MRTIESMSLREQILNVFPDFTDLPYYGALAAGTVTYEQSMRAHTQDLARSIGCRGLREIQLEHLNAALEHGNVTRLDASALREAIEDEVTSDPARSHYAVRLQMFANPAVRGQSLEFVRSLAPTRQATEMFRSLFESGSLITMTAAVGAIELWYVPVAERLEQLYLDLGYTPYQVATYTLHKEADVLHSQTALDFVETYVESEDWPLVIAAVRLGFDSVRLYDEGRLEAAESTTDFVDFFDVR